MGAGASVGRVAAWAELPWLRAGFSTRLLGESRVYARDGADGDLNLGWTAEDDPKIVARNRALFLSDVAGGAFEPELVTLRQVHGNAIHLVRRRGVLATPEGKAVLEGDGLITAERGLLLGVQTADCTPVLMADTRTHAVGAFHAGWRGTVARIAEHGVAAMTREFGSNPEELLAAIGPAIRMCCFAVGEEVREQFAREFVYADDLFVQDVSPDGQMQLYADLHTANQRQLVGAGLRPEAITTIAECSACARVDGHRKYFSHRAEKGFTGRMLSVIGALE